MRTKIETHLTPEQLLEFFKRCAQTKGGTRLATIQAIAEEFGVQISLMSATAFRDGPLSEYLEELKAKRELAETVATVAKNGAGLSDAAASVLSQKLFDQALALDTAGAGALEESNTLSLALSRLRLGDQRAKYLEARLEAMEREKAEWEEKRSAAKAALEGVKAKGGLTKDTLAKIEEAARLL